MIVRIQGEGQYRVPDEEMARINELDSALEAALQGPGYSEALAALLDEIRAHGTALPDEELSGSDVVLPAAEATAEEIRSLLSGDGLIPG